MPLEGSAPFCLNIPMYTFHTGTFHKRYNMEPETLKKIFKKQKQIVRYILNIAICPKKKGQASLIKLIRPIDNYIFTNCYLNLS